MERFGKAFLAMLESMLSQVTWMQVGKGEQHAALVTDLDRLAAEQNCPLETAGQLETPFHLRDCMTCMQALERKLRVLSPIEDIELVQ